MQFSNVKVKASFRDWTTYFSRYSVTENNTSRLWVMDLGDRQSAMNMKRIKNECREGALEIELQQSGAFCHLSLRQDIL